MLSMVFSIPLVFAGLVWNSYRQARRKARDGEPFRPEGKLRWTASKD